MNDSPAQRLAVVVGVVCIAMYSGSMMVTEGTSAWS
jgi:hypothetical protein